MQEQALIRGFHLIEAFNVSFAVSERLLVVFRDAERGERGLGKTVIHKALAAKFLQSGGGLHIGNLLTFQVIFRPAAFAQDRAMDDAFYSAKVELLQGLTGSMTKTTNDDTALVLVVVRVFRVGIPCPLDHIHHCFSDTVSHFYSSNGFSSSFCGLGISGCFCMYS